MHSCRDLGYEVRSFRDARKSEVAWDPFVAPSMAQAEKRGRQGSGVFARYLPATGSGPPDKRPASGPYSRGSSRYWFIPEPPSEPPSKTYP
jgi:hypothetical protein